MAAPLLLPPQLPFPLPYADIERVLRVVAGGIGSRSLTDFRERLLDGLATHLGYRHTTFFVGRDLAGVFQDATPLLSEHIAALEGPYVEEFHRIDPFATLAPATASGEPGPVMLGALVPYFRPEHERYMERFLFRNRLYDKVVIPLLGCYRTGGVGLLAREAGTFGPRDLAIATMLTGALTGVIDSWEAADEHPWKESLTPAELRVARLVVRGLTNAEIAKRLYVGVNTVKKHITAVQAKAGTRNRVELAARWRAAG
ncbi:helix-turn-helix transcriptional regulator [Actinacidiphila oryziradicis]|uniref:helix-turn-helix transcriptional regulator n=1 Tax=Actinacidiphila oryziradicis TaxID=2571141 RepID=UPI0023F17FDD|nr:helix-turn-helix transcriptional regulator [Actinacidiphila oryziradicis]MCW2871477.1 transcriptional regulator, LuxR family [Actinacidiphila oryziradicis]